MQSHRAASPTYIADVTSVGLDGFIRFRSDRRSFTMPYSALNPAHGVKTADIRRTESIHKISHVHCLLFLCLLCVPSIHRMPSSVPSSVPCLSTYYIRECLVCRVIPWIACVRLTKPRKMCTDAFGGNPKWMGSGLTTISTFGREQKLKRPAECNHGRHQHGRRPPRGTFGARGDRIEVGPDAPCDRGKRRSKGYFYPFTSNPSDATVILVTV
jgi:hypothetical protein